MNISYAAVAALIAFFFSGPIALPADRFWLDRADRLGVRYASIVIEYSLSDSCEPTGIRVKYARPAGFFDDESIARIVATQVGPYGGSLRHIRWPTDIGFSYIRCSIDSDGDVKASLTSRLQSSAGERPITVRLSMLGTKEAEFFVEARHQ